MSGDATPAQIAGVLVGLRAKGETADEIAGCADAMREHVVPVRPRERRSSTSSARAETAPARSTSRRRPRSSPRRPGLRWPSTATAPRARPAVPPTCSRRSVSRSSRRRSGSRESIDELGFGFMFARAHHPAMRHAAPVRQELGVRTVFNILGPLSNPAGACDGVFGVYSPALARTSTPRRSQGSAHAVRSSSTGRRARRALPVGPNLVVEVIDGDVREWELDPRTLGMYPGDPPASPAARRRRTPTRCGRSSPASTGVRRDAVLLNAAAALVAAGLADDLGEGVGLAAEAIDTGTAGDRLTQLVEFSRESRLMGRFVDALRGPACRRSPRSSAARRRPAPAAGCRPGGDRPRVRRSGRGGGLRPRRRAIRRHLGRPPRRARRLGRAAAGEGVLHDRERPARPRRSTARTLRC